MNISPAHGFGNASSKQRLAVSLYPLEERSPLEFDPFMLNASGHI